MLTCVAVPQTSERADGESDRGTAWMWTGINDNVNDPLTTGYTQ